MQPYLSIVAVSLNDDHGGNLIGRMQAFAQTIGDLSSKHQVAIELVIVEWNPLDDSPRLADVVDWPANDYATTRIITVDSSLHHKFESSKKLPLHQMIGKNVGIRRAHAPFVLATNIDIIFPDEFFVWLSSNALKANTMYRAVRYDVDKHVADPCDTTSRLKLARSSVIAINHRLGTTRLPDSSDSESRVNRRAMAKTERNLIAQRLKTLARLSIRLKRNASHIRYHTALLRSELGLPSPLPNCFTNASGDFQLMHKNDWEKIGGYWEYDGFILHLDTYASYVAHLSGINEQIQNFPIYHIDHSGSFVMQESKQDKYFESLEKRGLAFMNLEEVQRRIIKGPNAKVYENGDKWGLMEFDLPETLIGRA